MKTRTRVVTFLAAALVLARAPLARAQSPGVEVGTTLVSLIFDAKSPRTTVFGVPSAGFGIVNPGVYVSLFATRHLAVEPQIGLMSVSHSGDTATIANFAGQVDYFLTGTRVSSPYLFGSVGLLHLSGARETPASYGAGAGYRILAVGRVTLRVDGRFTHFTRGMGNQWSFGLSLGGVFGK